MLSRLFQRRPSSAACIKRSYACRCQTNHNTELSRANKIYLTVAIIITGTSTNKINTTHLLYHTIMINFIKCFRYV